MKNWLQKTFLLASALLLINFVAVGQTCDTLSNFSGNYQPAIIPVPAPGWGYVSGHNNYLDLAKAEYYNNTSSNTHVQGVIMAFGRAFTINPFATITATVWDGTGGTPGAVLEEKDVLIQNLMLSISMFQSYYAKFDAPVALPSNQFFVGFTMTTGTDTVAIVTNTPGNVPLGTGTAWERQSNGNWYNYNNAAASWGFDAAHAMFPVLVTPTEANFTPSNVTACKNVNVTFDGTPSVDAITYEWIMPGATPSTSTLASPTVTYNTAGTYDVTLIVTNGCMSDTLERTNAITIVNYCPPTCNLSTTIITNRPSCFGGNDGFATTQTSGGVAPYNYTWSSGVTNDTAFNLTTGSYTVTVTDANGCFVIASFSIGNPQQLAATGATTAPTTCNGTNGTATAIATGGNGNYTYLWNTMPAQNTATATGLGQGNYACTVTDGNGCITVIGVSVSDGCAGCTLALNPILTNASCALQNGSINPNVTGQSGTVTYNWSNGATTPTISGLAAGIYSVTVSDASNCTDSSTFVLVQSGIVTITMNSTDNFCSAIGASINTSIAGGATPYTYSWSNGATTSAITNLMTGSYSVTVADANGCSTTSSVAVTSIANGPSVMTTQTNVTCFGANDGTVNMSITGGNLPYAVFWSPLNISAQNLNSLAAGSYTAVVADQAGCLATTTIVITQPDSITLVGIATPTTTSTGTAMVNVAGGIPPYSYLWNNTGTTQMINNLVVGTYTVTVTDSKGCSKTTNVVVQDFISNTNNIEALTKFEVFPNPTNGEFSVRLDFTKTTDVQIRIFNIVGQPIIEINATDNSLNLPIDLSEYPVGMYLIMVQTETGRAIKRVMISE
jgi:PKD repeat protein